MSKFIYKQRPWHKRVYWKIQYKAGRCWWWTRGIIWDKFNIVKCKSLPPTWNDRDQLLLHAAFQCLIDFIDNEKPWGFSASHNEINEAYAVDGYICYSLTTVMVNTDKIIKDWDTIKVLYAWWNLRKDDYGSTSEDNKMLHKLIEIREYMWT